MANYTYPSGIKPPEGCDETSKDPSLRSEFDSGTVQTRPRFTRVRRTWKISWSILWGDEYEILRKFYETVRGGSYAFNWTHPREQKVYQVRFVGDLKCSCYSYNWWSVEFDLEQV